MRISVLVSSIAVLTCVGVNAVAAAHDSALRGGNDVVNLADTVEVKPIHCQMKPWGPWGPCGIDGYKERHREVDVMPNDIGRACPFNTDRIKCRKQDCVVCDWKEGECDKETGKKRFWREIIRQSELDGEPCPTNLERFDDCDVDCEAEDPLQYIEDDTCDANGDKWKYPKIKYDKKNNGADCPPRLLNGNCKQNCEYVPVPDNTGYGSCELEASSGKYYKTRPRVEAKPALYGGDPCLPDRIECTRQCYNSQPQKEFLSINSELNPSSQPTEAACCEYCKSLGNCKGYTYHAFFSGCYVVGSVDIIQGNIRAASSYVDFQ